VTRIDVFMRFCARGLVLLAGGLLSIAWAAPEGKPEGFASGSDASATLVLYNENDSDSVDLARFYAFKRGIPKDQVIGLRCALKEEITREEYDHDIGEPVQRLLTKKHWWTLREDENPLLRVEANKIRFVALMRGIPLKIAPTVGYPGDIQTGPPVISTRNEASVDSELAALAILSRTISGALNNPYFGNSTRFAAANLPALLLVCRLDAPNAATVKRMITDGIAAEQIGLRGFAYIDARGIKDPGLSEGDKWLLNLAADARQRGTPVILDNGEGLFPIPYPMRNASLYFGWYAENVTGPMLRPDFRFRPGAIVAHIHSFSASTLRDPKRFWAGPLLEAGAAATIGNVYEPFLSLTPNLDVFHQRLRAGLTFAESGWSSERVLSWMTTFIGDPLYRPYKIDADAGQRAAANEWDIYAADAKLWFTDRERARQQFAEDARKQRSGVLMEGLGLLELAADQPDAAIKSFGAARQFYKHSDDILRATIHEVIQLRARTRQAEALPLVRKQLELYGKAPAAEILRGFEREMAPAPKATPSAAPRQSAR